MSADVYSIVGLKRLDKAYIGLRSTDEVVSKVLLISEVAQIARAERRTREYIDAKWNARQAQAVSMASSMAARGKPADKVEGAVRQIMERWPRDIEDVFASEMDGIYKLARIAAYRKAVTRSKGSLQYDTPNYTEETVEKAKRTARMAPSFDVADEGSKAALKRHQLFWIGEHYEKNVSSGVAQVAREVIVEAGADRVLAGKLMAEKMAGALGSTSTPEGFRGSSKQYFEGLTANAATVARGHGQMRSFMDVGVTTYTIVNPQDERTCPFCGHMDGKVFSVKHGADQMHAELKAKTPGEVRKAHPWIGAKALRGISSKAGPAGAGDAEALAAAGQAMPPFHFRCRCTVDISEEAGSWDAVEPLSPPTEDEPAMPLAIAPEGEEMTPALRAEDKIIGAMRSGIVKTRKKITAGAGVNASEIVELETQGGDVVKGVWKDVDGEARALRPNIPVGTYYKREALTYQIDRMLGPGGVVPPTITRNMANAAGESVAGSFQSFAKGAKKGDQVQTALFTMSQGDGYASIPSFRRTFLLDAVSGNDDRHNGNIMFHVSKKAGDLSVRAVAIDNGLTFPEGNSVRFIFPGTPGQKEQAKFLKLDEASKKALKRLDLEKVAKTIKGSDVGREGARAALVRIKALQEDPDLLYKIMQGEKVRKYSTNPEGAMQAFVEHSADTYDKPEYFQLLPKKEFDAIDKILDDVYTAPGAIPTPSAASLKPRKGPTGR